jgi:hypothetical protein
MHCRRFGRAFRNYIFDSCSRLIDKRQSPISLESPIERPRSSLPQITTAGLAPAVGDAR